MSEKKKQDKKCGNLPAKEADAISWDRLLVYFIGPYKIRRDSYYYTLILKYLNITYNMTGWYKIVQQNDKQAYIISNVVDQ